MIPSNQQRPRRDRVKKARRAAAVGALECLETRQLLAYSPLGYSLPDLTIRAQAGPVVAYGGRLTVTVDVNNLGAASLVDPTHLAPGSASRADAVASTTEVYLSPTRKFNASTAIELGTIAVPAIPQNDTVRVSGTFAIPAHPAGYPLRGHNLYIIAQADVTSTNVESDTSNNFSNIVPVKVAPNTPLPDFQVVALDVPPVMSPGDTIQPNIRVANYGSAPAGPVTVELVASVDPTFSSGSSVIATYTISSIPSASTAPTKKLKVGDTNVYTGDTVNPIAGQANGTNTNPLPTQNIVTLKGANVTLPASPARYYIGVVVDPNHQVFQIKDLAAHPVGRVLEQPRVVGAQATGLPPAGVLSSPVTNTFPFPTIATTTTGTGGGTGTTPILLPHPFVATAVVTNGAVTPTYNPRDGQYNQPAPGRPAVTRRHTAPTGATAPTSVKPTGPIVR